MALTFVEGDDAANSNGPPVWTEVLAAQVLDPSDDNRGLDEISDDVEGRVVTISWTPPDIDGVEIDWADGSPVEYAASGSSHTYAEAGTYSISLDPYGSPSPQFHEVTVA